jgi:hypothetical protein
MNPDRARIASVLAPILRSLNRPIRKIHLAGGGVTDSHQVALVLARREGIEIDAARVVRGFLDHAGVAVSIEGIVKTCGHCGRQTVVRRRHEQYCSQTCRRRHASQKQKRKARGGRPPRQPLAAATCIDCGVPLSRNSSRKARNGATVRCRKHGQKARDPSTRACARWSAAGVEARRKVAA